MKLTIVEFRLVFSSSPISPNPIPHSIILTWVCMIKPAIFERNQDSWLGNQDSWIGNQDSPIENWPSHHQPAHPHAHGAARSNSSLCLALQWWCFYFYFFATRELLLRTHPHQHAHAFVRQFGEVFVLRDRKLDTLESCCAARSKTRYPSSPGQSTRAPSPPWFSSWPAQSIMFNTKPPRFWYTIPRF